MSAGKRIAKRSIIGARICAPTRETGHYNPGKITGLKNPDELSFNNCHTGITSNSKFIVRFDNGETREFSESELVGPGFGNVSSLKLRSGQKVFVTNNGREVSGNVVYHRPQIDEVLINIPPTDGSNEVSKIKRKNCVILCTRGKLHGQNPHILGKHKETKKLTGYVSIALHCKGKGSE